MIFCSGCEDQIDFGDQQNMEELDGRTCLANQLLFPQQNLDEGKVTVELRIEGTSCLREDRNYALLGAIGYGVSTIAGPKCGAPCLK